jgi:hypothetical protein
LPSGSRIVADGFYEWAKTPAGRKQPYFISVARDQPFAFAGLWESWDSPDGEGSRVAADGTVVTAHLTGDFPGNPVDLRYRFKLAGPEIIALEIS